MATVNDGTTLTLTSQGGIGITQESLSSSIGMYFRASIPAVYRTDIVQIGLLGSQGNKSVYLTLSNTSGSIDYQKSYVSVTIESQASNDSDTAILVGNDSLTLYNTGDAISIFIDYSYVVVSLNDVPIAKGYVDFELDSSYRFFTEFSSSQNQQTYSISNILFYPVGTIGRSVGVTTLTSSTNEKHLITPNTYRFYVSDILESVDTFNANDTGIYLSFLLKLSSERIRSSEDIFNDRIRFGLRDVTTGTYIHFYIRQLEFPGYADCFIFKDDITLRFISEPFEWPATFSMLCDTANITFIINGETKWTEYIPFDSKYKLLASAEFLQNTQIPRYYEVTDILFHPTGRVGSLGPQGATGPQGAAGTSTTIAPLKRITAISKTGFEILLSSNATLAVNDAIEFIADVGNVPRNRVFYVRTKIGTNKITIKTSIGETAAY
jgi:hypothetical protein